MFGHSNSGVCSWGLLSISIYFWIAIGVVEVVVAVIVGFGCTKQTSAGQ